MIEPVVPAAPASPVDDLLIAARYEASEDRRIAALMRQQRNRAQLEQRADVTDALIAEIERLRAKETAMPVTNIPDETKASDVRYCDRCGAQTEGAGAWGHDDNCPTKPIPMPRTR